MEEKILVYLDKNKVEHARSDYFRTANRVQKVIDFLKSHKIECDIKKAHEIIEFNSIVEDFVKKSITDIPKDFPEALRSLINDDIDKVIKDLKKIALEARECITNNNYHKIDYSKLEIVDDKVIVSDEALNECNNFGAVYIDTATRGKIYNCAQIALKALQNLQKSVDEAEKRGIMPGYHISGINRDLQFGYGSSILIVDEDGEVHLNNEVFYNIV